MYGNIIWYKELDICVFNIEASKGKIYLVGGANSGGTIICIDPDGRILWQVSFDQIIYSIAIHDDMIYLGGNRIIATLSLEGKIVDVMNISMLVGGIVFWGDSIYIFGGFPVGCLLRLDKEWNIIWIRYFGDVLSKIYITQDGYIYAVGGYAPGFIVKLNSDGEILWKYYIGNIVYSIGQVRDKIMFCGGDYPAFIGWIRGDNVVDIHAI